MASIGVLPGKGTVRISSTKLWEDQDLEKAHMPLYAQQQQLPDLPVPPLSEMLSKYLTSVRPLLSDQEFEATSRKVREFGKPGGMGETLHARLKERAASCSPRTSFFSEWWQHAAYLDYRDPVVVFVSYFFHFVDDPKHPIGAAGSQVARAARLARGVLEFRAQLKSGELAQEKLKKGGALCSAAYKYMFDCTRIPVKGTDVVALYDPAGASPTVAVVRKNRFYVFDAWHPSSGRLLTSGEIERQLRIIKAQADMEGAAPNPVGLLTSENRDLWTAARQGLIKEGPEGHNLRLLTKIQEASFLICLDDSSPVAREDVGRGLWHGDGANRWFDKAVQVIVFENGKAGLLGEHSMMDGQPMLRMQEYVNSGLASGRIPTEAGEPSSLPAPTSLRFLLGPQTRAAIGTARANFQALVDRHNLKTLVWHGFGKQAIKGFKMSPDAFTQMAIHLASVKFFGRAVGTYESTSTRKFRHGRTEVTRSASSPAYRWAQAMLSNQVSDGERHKLLEWATQAHSKYARAASNGIGVDRPLNGMKRLLKPGEDATFFQDPAFGRSCHWNISTSTLASEFFDGWGWGEVVPDGFGVAYSVRRNRINFNVTSCNKGWAEAFVQHLEDALIHMTRICTKASQIKSKL